LSITRHLAWRNSQYCLPDMFVIFIVLIQKNGCKQLPEY
jgi:hypothetical protein